MRSFPKRLAHFVRRCVFLFTNHASLVCIEMPALRPIINWISMNLVTLDYPILTRDSREIRVSIPIFQAKPQRVVDQTIGVHLVNRPRESDLWMGSRIGLRGVVQLSQRANRRIQVAQLPCVEQEESQKKERSKQDHCS